MSSIDSARLQSAGILPREKHSSISNMGIQSASLVSQHLYYCNLGTHDTPGYITNPCAHTTYNVSTVKLGIKIKMLWHQRHLVSLVERPRTY
ncbi:hypothetical protein Hypma_006796 [Hypsizygus marmoreus]|uniref:Uncharacterized protein n=1 Tax=Hypsizygus marmoreus TaxID=39966 RepID=A0A369JWD0_HYPMA|nr:hypothetical protein Hypma_006796 [Hypsizygus marmoreus]